MKRRIPQANVFQSSWLTPPRGGEYAELEGSRATRVRRLGLLGLALVALLAFACATPRPAPRSLWDADIRALGFVTCQETVSENVEFCRCLVGALEAVQPDPEAVTAEDARSAARACHLPPPAPEKT